MKRDKLKSILENLGIRYEEAEHWAGILCKKDSFNYCPDCEVLSYMKLFWKYCNNPQERRWAGHSYAACHFMWKNLAEIWNYRKSLPLSKRLRK